MRDPLRELGHDHADINRRVLELAALIRSQDGELARPLRELREQLFLHFAREEEGLFPFVRETVPERAEHVQLMETAHDTICGAVARMVHLATAGGDRAAIAQLFQRFESAYGDHATAEAALLAGLEQRLDAAQRARLADLVAGL